MQVIDNQGNAVGAATGSATTSAAALAPSSSAGASTGTGGIGDFGDPTVQSYQLLESVNTAKMAICEIKIVQ